MRAIIFVLVLASTADAQLFRRRAVVKRVVVQQVVAVPQVQTLFLVAPPSYYGAPAYRAPAPAVKSVESDDLQQIIESLALIAGALGDLEKRMDRMEGVSADVLPPQPVPAVPRVIEQQCGKCHTGPEAKGDFELALLITPEARLKAAGKISLGLMPLGEDEQPATIPMETRDQLLSALKEMGS